jgi:hypothetical protein
MSCGGGSLSHPDAIVRAVVAEEHDRAILPASVASQYVLARTDVT